MKLKKKIKLNQKVFDRWYFWKKHGNIYGTGKVEKITKSTVHVKFRSGTVIYDFEHANEFLEKYSQSNVKKLAI